MTSQTTRSGSVDALEEIFFRYLAVSTSWRGVGFSSNLRVRCFLDLLTAAHDPGALSVMVMHLAALARTEGVADRNGVLAPKWGNVLLCRDLAVDLGLGSGYFKADPLFGSWLEGPVSRGDHWVLVDDVASDGERLEDLVMRVRECGVRITQAIFLVERLEGDVRESLRSVGVEMSAVMQLNDSSLESLQVRRRALPTQRDGSIETPHGDELTGELLSEAKEAPNRKRRAAK